MPYCAQCGGPNDREGQPCEECVCLSCGTRAIHPGCHWCIDCICRDCSRACRDADNRYFCRICRRKPSGGVLRTSMRYYPPGPNDVRYKDATGYGVLHQSADYLPALNRPVDEASIHARQRHPMNPPGAAPARHEHNQNWRQALLPEPGETEYVEQEDTSQESRSQATSVRWEEPGDRRPLTTISDAASGMPFTFANLELNRDLSYPTSFEGGPNSAILAYDYGEQELVPARPARRSHRGRR